MKAHELARLLLEGPDLTVIVTENNDYVDEYASIEEVTEASQIPRSECAARYWNPNHWSDSWGDVAIRLR